jgi:hypothetical protein
MVNDRVAPNSRKNPSMRRAVTQVVPGSMGADSDGRGKCGKRGRCRKERGAGSSKLSQRPPNPEPNAS